MFRSVLEAYGVDIKKDCSSPLHRTSMSSMYLIQISMSSLAASLSSVKVERGGGGTLL